MEFMAGFLCSWVIVFAGLMLFSVFGGGIQALDDK